MTATVKTDKPEDNLAAANEFEGEIREFVRKDVAPWRKRADAPNEPVPENVNFLVQRVAGASVSEIDSVIAELQNVRELLRNEGDRVQREIASYANLSQAAMASMKVIAESMAQWRSSVATPQNHE